MIREDIAAIPIMEASGWKVVMDPRDIQMGRQESPNHSYSFEKGIMHLWRAINGNNIEWRYAELIDDHYTNHKWITIEEATKLCKH